MPVAYLVGWAPVVRRNAVSSTPIAVGAPSRAGSSMIGSPRVVTMRMIVAQPTPSADATRDTAPSRAPTCSNAHARARSVRHARGSIAGCCSVQVFLGHNAYGQHQTRLCQHTTTGLPPIGRSRTHTARRSFGRATAPQSGHGTTPAMVSTSSSSSPPASAAASTRNPSNPNNAATTESVTSASTWGSSTIRVILVVITDRASPRPTISSFQSPRRVARSPHSQFRGEEPDNAAPRLRHNRSRTLTTRSRRRNGQPACGQTAVNRTCASCRKEPCDRRVDRQSCRDPSTARLIAITAKSTETVLVRSGPLGPECTPAAPMAT
jgi:hypothetical protein